MAMEKKNQTSPCNSFVYRDISHLLRTGVVVNKVADFLREQGFNASAQPAIGGDINMIPSPSTLGSVTLAKTAY